MSKLPDQGPEALKRFGMTADEQDALLAFDAILAEVQAHTNLVSRSSWETRWTRHYADSLQLFDCIPADAGSLLDIGSGAGFPVIPLAIRMQNRRPGFELRAVESAGKKARFLSRVKTDLTLANLHIHHERSEQLQLKKPTSVVTARAVANLSTLLGLAAPHLASGGLMIFPKGQRAEQELDEASKHWSFDARMVKSHTDPEAKIILVQHLERIV